MPVARVENIGARLAGAWHLVAIELPGPDGTMATSPASGCLVITPDGHMAVQVRSLDPLAPDTPYSRGGYEASYGKITLDPANAMFTYHVEGALVRDLVGRDFPRAYRFVEDQLILTSTEMAESWRIVWRRG